MLFSDQQLQQLRELLDERLEIKLEEKLEEKLEAKFQAFRVSFKEELLIDVHQLIHHEHNAISLEIKTRLEPLQNDIAHVKQRIEGLFVMESEDIMALHQDNLRLERRIKKLEENYLT